jgi:hypothetical protein
MRVYARHARTLNDVNPVYPQHRSLREFLGAIPFALFSGTSHAIVGIFPSAAVRPGARLQINERDRF